MDLNNRKITNHPPSLVTIVKSISHTANDPNAGVLNLFAAIPIQMINNSAIPSLFFYILCLSCVRF